MEAIVAKLRDLLKGETLRAIGYGSVAVIFLVTRAYVALGLAPAGYEAPAVDAIVLAVAAATTAVVEFARRFVYSPNSVETILSAIDSFEAVKRVPVETEGDTE
jgi:hypothetical protein